jgi:hypothetical protein
MEAVSGVNEYSSPEIDEILAKIEVVETDGVKAVNDGVKEVVYTPSNVDMMTAATAIKLAQAYIEEKFQPLTLGDEFATEGTEKLAIVMAKYDGVMPPWMKEIFSQYKEELDLAVFAGGAAFGFYQEVKKHEKVIAEQKKAEKKEPRKPEYINDDD